MIRLNGPPIGRIFLPCCLSYRSLCFTEVRSKGAFSSGALKKLRPLFLAFQPPIFPVSQIGSRSSWPTSGIAGLRRICFLVGLMQRSIVQISTTRQAAAHRFESLC